MNERTFRFPSGWEWLQFRQPFAQDLHQQPAAADARLELQSVSSLHRSLPPRSNRSTIDKQPENVRRSTEDEINREKHQRMLAEERLLSLKQRLPECSAWLDDCFERSLNHIVVHRLEDGQPVLYGTLLIQQSADKSDTQPLRFWVTNNRLITIHDDWRLSIRMQQPPWDIQLQQCATGIEAFVATLSALLELLHHGLDGFESRLGELEHAMRKRNRMNLMASIFERRYDLLHWSHLFMPIKELNSAVKEAFVTDAVTQSESYLRLQHKLERIESLLQAYALEIDTLISMDDAISSFRGNDIMKTLTIFTALFTPATVAGTLWGMNFRRLPFASEAWGFLGMCAIVLIATVAIYVWLWRKGWTGDLLNARLPGPGSAEKTSASSRSRTSRGRGRSRKRAAEQDAKRQQTTSAWLAASLAEAGISDIPRRRK